MDKEYLPLALLAFSTRLPELVFIRALKPDVRALFNLVPFNVLFVIDYFYVINNNIPSNKEVVSK
jgi:hypothetical protein